MSSNAHIRRLLGLGAAALTSLAIAPAAHAVTVKVEVVGAGVVSSAGTEVCRSPLATPDTTVGITCPLFLPVQSSAYSVGYEPAPAVSSGWKFTGWEGCDAVSGDVCKIEVPSVFDRPRADATITAKFDDVAAPETKVLYGPPPVYWDTEAEIGFEADDAGTTGSTFECEIDSGSRRSCSSRLRLSGLADGPHTVRVWATDPSGNADASPATHTWTVDTVAPDFRLVSGPPQFSNSSSARFSFAGRDVVRIKCYVDGARRDCIPGTPLDLTGLADGPHELKAYGQDRASNNTLVKYEWTVDTAAPDTTISSGPAHGSSTTGTTARFGLAASEPGSRLECKLDGEPDFAPCSRPDAAEFSGLEPGRHVVEVRAIDVAGNADPTPAWRWWTVVVADQPPAGAPAAGQPASGGTPGTAQSKARLTYRAKAGKRFTRITKLAVDGLSAGAKVTVSCAGKGCTLRSKTVTAAGASVVLSKLVRKAKLRPGAVLTVTVPGQPTTKLTIRRGKAPRLQVA
jgi:hypothetical protein